MRIKRFNEMNTHRLTANDIQITGKTETGIRTRKWKISLISLVDLMEKNIEINDPFYKRELKQNNFLTAKGFILNGEPSSEYILKILDYLMELNVDIDKIYEFPS